MSTSSDIYVANTSAALNFQGENISITKDVTRVRAGHALLKKFKDFFDPLEVQFDVEQASARPGELRGSPRSHAVEEPAKPAPAAGPTPAADDKPAKTSTDGK